MGSAGVQAGEGLNNPTFTRTIKRLTNFVFFLFLFFPPFCHLGFRIGPPVHPYFWKQCISTHPRQAVFSSCVVWSAGVPVAQRWNPAKTIWPPVVIWLRKMLHPSVGESKWGKTIYKRAYPKYVSTLLTTVAGISVTIGEFNCRKASHVSHQSHKRRLLVHLILAITSVHKSTFCYEHPLTYGTS